MWKAVTQRAGIEDQQEAKKMKNGYLILVATVLACVLVSGSVSGQQSFTLTNQPLEPDGDPISPGTAPGYVFLYESFMQVPGTYLDEYGNPFTRDDWFYDYWIENASTEFTIMAWYWEWTSPGGDYYDGWIDGELIWDSPLDPPGTYPPGTCNQYYAPVPPSGSPLGEVTDKYHEKYFNSPCPPIIVNSTIWFDDEHFEVWPVYIPQCFVPEPGTLAGLASMVGLLGGLIRRRR